MSDARFPQRWITDARVQGLSGDDFRAFMHALAWSVSNGTDGVIRPENLPLIYRVDAAAMAVFVAAELCAELTDGWLFVDYLTTQTTAAQLESAARGKANARERQARKRLKELAAQGDVTRDVTRDVPRDSVGQARQGISSNVSSPSRNKSLDKKPKNARDPSENSHEARESFAAYQRRAHDIPTDAERAALKRREDRNIRDGYDQ
jgi:hypothetical protein